MFIYSLRLRYFFPLFLVLNEVEIAHPCLFLANSFYNKTIKNNNL